MDKENDKDITQSPTIDLHSDLVTFVSGLKTGNEQDVHKSVSRMRALLHGLPVTHRFGSEKEEQEMFKPLVTFLKEEGNQKIKNKCWTNFRTILSDKHSAMLDLYKQLSAVFAEIPGEPNATEALEYAGRAVLVCTNVNGLLSEHTAECHYVLGLLYKAIHNTDAARKEMVIAKGIRKKLSGPLCEAIADCDYALGDIELGASKVRPDRVYNRCAHCDV